MFLLVSLLTSWVVLAVCADGTVFWAPVIHDSAGSSTVGRSVVL